jgi:putative aminopeptidase FrvX
MSDLPTINQEYLRKVLIELLQTPSPTGYTEDVILKVRQYLEELGFSPQISPKGTLISTWNGDDSSQTRALTAHVDTLGAMVKEIKDNGRIKLTPIGGYAWNTIEGEGCTIFTSKGTVRGSILLNKASGHIYGEAVGKSERDESTLEVRLDELSNSKDETLALGVKIGDFVAFDPRVETGPAGFIRSRHLDDKAGVACILAAIQAMRDAGKNPAQTTTIHISNYEEVGHGAASGFPKDLHDLIAVDMAVVGEGQESDEHHVTICVKDRGGPYHHGFNQQLRHLAESHGIPYKVDIYPYYGSDGEAYWRAGGDVRVALIGPGIDASHNYERTHLDALIATTQLICAYLLN